MLTPTQQIYFPRLCAIRHKVGLYGKYTTSCSACFSSSKATASSRARREEQRHGTGFSLQQGRRIMWFNTRDWHTTLKILTQSAEQYLQLIVTNWVEFYYDLMPTLLLWDQCLMLLLRDQHLTLPQRGQYFMLLPSNSYAVLHAVAKQLIHYT